MFYTQTVSTDTGQKPGTSSSSKMRRRNSIRDELQPLNLNFLPTFSWKLGLRPPQEPWQRGRNVDAQVPWFNFSAWCKNFRFLRTSHTQRQYAESEWTFCPPYFSILASVMALPGKLPEIHFFGRPSGASTAFGCGYPKMSTFCGGGRTGSGQTIPNYTCNPTCLTQSLKVVIKGKPPVSSILFYLTWVTRSFNFPPVLTIAWPWWIYAKKPTSIAWWCLVLSKWAMLKGEQLASQTVHASYWLICGPSRFCIEL